MKLEWRLLLYLSLAIVVILGGWVMAGGRLEWRGFEPSPIPRPVERPDDMVVPTIGQPLNGYIDRIVIHKSLRQLSVYQDGALVRRYRVALGFEPEGDKVMADDGRTPEGLFVIDRRNEGSRFHRSLRLNYPRPEDIARAAEGGYDPGGDIYIHGQPNRLGHGYRVQGDWTAGCIAIGNQQIDEMFPFVPLGTVVEIRP